MEHDKVAGEVLVDPVHLEHEVVRHLGLDNVVSDCQLDVVR